MEAALRSAPLDGALSKNAVAARVLRRSLIVLLVALSMICGMVVGFYLGFQTGVKPGLQAGATLSQALPWKTEIASEPAETQEIARLLDEVRRNRAQIEAMRHVMESSRAMERSGADLLARLDRLEERLNRVIPASVDFTLTSAIPKLASGGSGDDGQKGAIEQKGVIEPKSSPKGAHRTK